MRNELKKGNEMKNDNSLSKNYKNLKKLNFKDLKKELKSYSSRTLFNNYNNLEYSQRHSRVGRAMFDSVMENSGSYSK